MKKNYRLDSSCLDCGQEVAGKFCSHCGQENIETKEHVGYMLTHAIGDYFHFDSKFIKTMKPLLFQPGLLTNEYNAGKRTTYLPAIRMYIFISIVFFLALSIGNTRAVKFGSTFNEQQEFEKIDQIQFLTNSQKRNAKVRLQNQIEKEKNLKKLTAEEYAAEQKALPVSSRDGSIRYYFQHKARELKDRENIQEVFSQAFFSNLPKMMFLLLPLFALTLMLIFKKSGMFYAEHFIYALHLHSFLYLFLLLPVLMGKVMSVPGLIYWVVFWVITMYIYKSLRTVYKNSRKKTILKMAIMGTSYSFLLGICLYLSVLGIFLML